MRQNRVWTKMEMSGETPYLPSNCVKPWWMDVPEAVRDCVVGRGDLVHANMGGACTVGNGSWSSHILTGEGVNNLHAEVSRPGSLFLEQGILRTSIDTTVSYSS